MNGDLKVVLGIIALFAICTFTSGAIVNLVLSDASDTVRFLAWQVGILLFFFCGIGAIEMWEEMT